MILEVPVHWLRKQKEYIIKSKVARVAIGHSRGKDIIGLIRWEQLYHVPI